MLTVITGQPGNGKTLYTIDHVRKLAADTGRPVFYFGIDDVADSLGWHQLQVIDDWYTCPDGALIIFDEAWRHFPMRKVGDQVPRHVQETAEHRHKGYDLFLVTQHGTQIDTFCRKMCSQHIHVKRNFGMQSAILFKWGEIADPANYHDQQKAQKERFKYPTDVFDLYKSAEIHTVKNTIPWKRIALLAAPVLLIPVAIWLLSASIFSSADDQVIVESSSVDPNRQKNTDLPDTVPAAPGRMNLYSRAVWAPEIQDIPFSARFYDELVVPKTLPKINGCMRHTFDDGRDWCKCSSQQGTTLEISHQACIDFLNYGWFDFSDDRPYYADIKPFVQDDGRAAQVDTGNSRETGSAAPVPASGGGARSMLPGSP